MDCQVAKNVTSYSDPELSNVEMVDLEASLTRHSHFFGSTRCRLSAPVILLDDAASPMLTVLDGSSTERIDGVARGGEGEGRESGGSEVGSGGGGGGGIR